MINIKFHLIITHTLNDVCIIRHRFKCISGLWTAITFYVCSMYFLTISLGKVEHDVTWFKVWISYDRETELTAAC